MADGQSLSPPSTAKPGRPGDAAAGAAAGAKFPAPPLLLLLLIERATLIACVSSFAYYIIGNLETMHD